MALTGTAALVLGFAGLLVGSIVSHRARALALVSAAVLAVAAVIAYRVALYAI